MRYEISVCTNKLYGGWLAAVRSPVTEEYLHAVGRDPAEALVELAKVLKNYENNNQ